MYSRLQGLGLPAPDPQQLYFGNGELAADQQAMPAANLSKGSRQRNSKNGSSLLSQPQLFALFFVDFPFGYALAARNWFSAEGIPLPQIADQPPGGRS